MREERNCSTKSVGFVNPIAIYEELTIEGKGKKVSARVIRPRARGVFPLVLMFHYCGRKVRGWHHMTRFLAAGWGVVAMEHELNGSPVPADYELNQLKECCENAILLMQEAKKLAWVKADRLVTWGEGFGGALAIAAAAEEDGTVGCVVLNPMPATIEGGDGTSFELPWFASRVKGSVLMGTCLMDEVADVDGQYAVFEAFPCKKRHLIYPKYMHERVNFFEDELLKFLAKAEENS